ncbi:MAG: flippase-like domain-containing protein [Kofleriaceae bacterium]|nr:MAG: flippase-like domain-containing protein [Kofleriaceae bacterium]MBZ0230977.1 flippase-like domain-containing protein [Kofleriaceae bacterium]
MTDAAVTAELDEDSGSPSWTRWFTMVAIAIAIVAFGLTVWSVGPGQLVAQLSAIGWGFAGVLAIEAVATSCDSAALSGFLGPGGRRPSYLYVLRAQIMGRAINAVTPLASLGEAVKAASLMERTSSPRAIGAVIRYNLASFGMRLAVIAIGAPLCALLLEVPAWLSYLFVIGGLVALLVIAAGVWLVSRGMLASGVALLRRVRFLARDRADRWRGRAVQIDRHLRADRTCSLRARWAPAAWVVLARLLNLASLWLVVLAAGTLIGPGTMAAVSTAGQLINALASLVPLGIGISEAGNAALFSALDESPSLGVAMILGSRISTLAYAAIGLFLITTTAVLESRR